MVGFFDLIVAQDNATATRETQRENSSRMAISAHTVETLGNTSVRLAEPIMFELAYLEPPFVATSTAIKTDFDAASGWIPDCNVGVWQWHRNAKGHYTGAYVYVGVKPGSFGAVLQHHLVFVGIAFKDLGQEVVTEAQLLASRPVGFGGI